MTDKIAVKFSRGTSSAFAALPEKDIHTLYFIDDTHEIYLGENRYAYGDSINVIISGEGNVVESVDWDQSTLTLTIHRGNMLTRADVESIVDAVLNGYTFVDPDDDILYQHDGYIKSQIAIDTSIDSATGHTFVVLKGKDDQIISSFDAAEFTKDHGLESVELIVNPENNHHMIVFHQGQGFSTLELDVEPLVSAYNVAEGGGIDLNNHVFKLSNEIEDSGGYLDSNKIANFGESFTLTTIKYDAHGQITGKAPFTVTMPAFPAGEAGEKDRYSKLLTYFSIDETGVTSQSVDLVDDVSTEVTNTQIPTAKAVKDSIDDSTSTWNYM